MAGKPQTLATTSAFEILGPVMVGPSSSHTAGALRCAQVAASLLEGRITKVTFGLWNSFAHTYRGHGTDRALVAGILGLDTDDENIKQAFDLAHEQGLEYHFDIKGDDASIHPNTVDIDMVDDTGATAQVRGESLGGGKMRISRINGVGVDISGMYSTLFVAHYDVPGVLAALTNLLAYAHVNIAFCRTYRTEVGGQAYSVFETDGAPDDTVIPMLRKLDNVDYATFIELPGSASSLSPGVSAKEIFDDGEQLLDACEEQGLSIGAVMAVREARLTGEAHAVAAMRRVLDVMREETTAPLANPLRSLGGLIGGGRLLELLTLEGEFAEDTLAFRIHNHALTVFEIAHQDLLGDGVLDVALNHAAQRTGTEQRVEALLREQVLGGVGEFERHMTVEQAVVELLDVQIHDLAHLRLGELLEDDDVVQTVQELRAELLLQFGADLVLHALVAGLVVGT